MSYVWFLVVLLMAGGGYFEYQNLQQSLAADDQRYADLQAKMASTTASDQKNLADKDGQLTQAQQSIKSLEQQVQDAQTQLAQAKANAAPATGTPMPAPAATSSPASVTGLSSTKLGTLSTLDGKTYQDCKLLKVDADGIVVNHTAGITKILFNALSPEMQKTFGYDPHVETALSPDQVLADETKRQMASATGN